MKKNIMQRVTSYEDACKIEKREPLTLEQFAFMGADAQRGFSNHCLDIINDALREGVVFDYENSNQPKWFPYARNVPGSGFVLVVVDCAVTFSYVGARRSFVKREIAVYAFTQFIEHYRNTL
jgi:hypothetical protein